MRTSAKIKTAGAIALTTLAYGLFAFTSAAINSGSSHFPAAAEERGINQQLKSQEMSISGLDSKIAAYWTAITDASAAGKVAIPDSPYAYCQNPPLAGSQLESGLNSLLCSSLETRAQISGALPALQAQVQATNEKARHEHDSWVWRPLTGAGNLILSVLAYLYWDTYRRQERYRQQNSRA